MSESCAICQNSGEKLKNIHTIKIGEPPILIKDLLKQCFDESEQLPNGIEEGAEITSLICINCVNKLLEFYGALLELALKRKEFQRLLKPRTGSEKAEITKLLRNSDDDDDSSNVLCEIEKVEWEEEELKPDIENVTWNTLDKDEIAQEQESLALLHTRLEYDEKFDRYCGECAIECPNEKVLELHVKKVHGKCDSNNTTAVSELCCPKCDKELPTKNAYKEHLHKCQKVVGAQIKCSHCEKTFNYKSHLTAHLLTHFSYPCSYCSKNFQKKRALKHHLETEHIDIKRFQCDECGNLYSSSKSLKKHKMVHSDIRNFTCDECPRRFRNSSHLKRHKLTHSGLKPHVCPICYRTFALKYNMASHMREHSKPGNLTKRLECSNCRKFFTAQQLLKQHLDAGGCDIAKEGAVPNQINDCDAKFEQRSEEIEIVDSKTEIEFITDQYPMTYDDDVS